MDRRAGSENIFRVIARSGDAAARGKEAREVIATRNEHTLASSCQVSGRGYWSGREVHVVCHPAGVGQGIVMVRTDLAERPTCPATIQHASGITFRTMLACGDASFAMVEHLMAALAGLEIDNCTVEVSAEELPGLDGSSLPYVEALQSAGLIIQPAARQTLVVDSPIRVELGESWITAHPCDGPTATIQYQLDYGDDGPIFRQTHRTLLSPRTFARQIAPARTFVTAEQAEMLRQQGVAQHVTPQDLLVIGPHGPVDNQWRFRDECARHKLLDLIGDLSLAGVSVVAEIVSHRGGHRLNSMMATRLREVAAAQPAVPWVNRLVLSSSPYPLVGTRSRRQAG